MFLGGYFRDVNTLDWSLKGKNESLFVSGKKRKKMLKIKSLSSLKRQLLGIHVVMTVTWYVFAVWLPSHKSELPVRIGPFELKSKEANLHSNLRTEKANDCSAV